jgi:hypothetical protein
VRSFRPSCPGALGVLRSRAWRPLLLAFALLAVWAQILAPAGAVPHAPAGAALLCLPSDAVRMVAQGELPVVATDAPACPFCRLPEPPASLVAEPAIPGPVATGRVTPVHFHDADAPTVFVALHLARGPPRSERSL